MTTEELKDQIKNKTVFTIAQLQYEYKLPYGAVRDCVLQLSNEGWVKLQDGITYCVNSEPQFIFDPFSEPSPEQYDGTRRVDLTNIKSTAVEKVSKRGENANFRSLSEMFFKNDCVVSISEVQPYARDPFFNGIFAGIYGINYGDNCANATIIINKAFQLGYKLSLQFIKFGLTSMRFIFKYASGKYQIKDFCNCRREIAAALGMLSVDIIAPYGYNKISITVTAQNALHPLCKKALYYFLIENGKIASADAIRSKFNTDSYTSRQIMDILQKLNCVESTSGSAAAQFNVKVSLYDMHQLFPSSLGWQI